MSDNELIHNVRELRDRGLSPKEIARSLGIRPAAVSDLVRKLAVEREAADPTAITSTAYSTPAGAPA